MPRTASLPDQYQPIRRRTVRGARFAEGTHRMGGEIPWHSHADPTMCFVLRGRFSEYSAGHVADCTPSTLKLMPAGERHWNRFAHSDVHGLMGELDVGALTGESGLGASLDQPMQFTSGPEVQLAHRLYQEFRHRDAAAPVAMEGLLLELVVLLARHPDRHRPGDCPAWVLRAREMAVAPGLPPLGIAAMAREVGVHPATLARGFRRAFGCSIGEMQRQARMDRALAALRDGHQPISEVALGAGFYDQSHFTNLFRRMYATTPARYRRAFVSS